jgi:thiamine transport system ATP-binding protein
MQRLPRARITERVDELLELVGLPGTARRQVAELSGGEQQRVALARALAPRPRVLMLDEPLGQLDRTLRERLIVDLRALFVRLRTTVLAVTHDQGEAFALADRVVVMDGGRIVQVGPPQDVWQRPASEFVARFLGFTNVVPSEVGDGVAGTPWGPVAAVGEGCHVLVRPAGVLIERGGPLAATVTGRTFRGDSVAVLLAPQTGPPLEATCRLADAPAVGDAVRVRLDPAEVVVLP